MLSESFLRAKKSNYKEEESWKMKMRVLEREEDTRRKFYIFHIEKVRTTKWKSLEQIKSSIHKDNSRKIPEQEEARASVLSNRSSQQDNTKGEIPGIMSSEGGKNIFTTKAKKVITKPKEVKDWSKYSYEKYLVMLKELELTLRTVPEEPIEEKIEVQSDIPEMILPKIIIQPYTDSENDERIEIVQHKLKGKIRRKRMDKPKNIDFGRIKYLKNLKQVKALNFANK